MIKLIVSIAICELTGILGGLATASSVKSWYVGLNKPSLNPPGWLFGPVWTTLYLLMGISLYLVWNKAGSMPIKAALWIFAVQLALNLVWSILFFGMHSPLLGLIDIAILWLAIIATILAFLPISHWAAYLLLPYLAWVSFASYLNFEIWKLN